MIDSAAPSIDGHLLRFQDDQEYFLYDTETCNLNTLDTSANYPWEYAWQVFTKHGTIKSNQFFVNWELAGVKIKVSAGAAVKTRYYEKVPFVQKDGIHPKEALALFEAEISKDRFIIAHNGLGFDQHISNVHREKLGLLPDYSFHARFLDSSIVSKAYKMGLVWPRDRAEWPAFQERLRRHRVKGLKHSVKFMCEEFGIPYDEQLGHAGDYDVEVTKQVFLKLIGKYEI